MAQLAGSQTVKRTVTSVVNPYFQHKSQEYTVHVDAPEGYTVTVNPSTLKLKAGETATYEVTITNVDAPIGEWRFGSLTWKDQRRQYSVRSPIAVKAALFDAPAEISGAGESGSVAFDVSFGYTGAYTAAAHGLEPAVVAADNVLQDPDQTFDPVTASPSSTPSTCPVRPTSASPSRRRQPKPTPTWMSTSSGR